MKTVVLIIGIILIVTNIILALVIPQIMIKNVGKRVAKYKYKEGIPVDKEKATVIGKRCLSVEEGRSRTIRDADDCEFLIQREDGTQQYYFVPYGLYMQIDEKTTGTLYLQEGELKDFREEYMGNDKS